MTLSKRHKIVFQLGAILVVVGFFAIRPYVLYLRNGVHVCLWPLLPSRMLKKSERYLLKQNSVFMF